MNSLRISSIYEGDEGPEFVCPNCGVENVLDFDYTTYISLLCHACRREIALSHDVVKGKWSDEEVAYLVQQFPHSSTSEVAYHLQRSISGTQQKAMKMGIRKTEAFMRSPESGIKRKGDTPWNKGLSYMPGGRCSDGWFKQGHKPKNTKHDGAITIRNDKSGRQYPHIRIAEGHWKTLHVHVWEQTHGPVPEGMIVVFKDGNTFRPDLNNLELITRAENMKRNTIHRFPPALKEQIRLLAKLERKIKNHAKK